MERPTTRPAARYEVPEPPPRPASQRAALLDWTGLLAVAVTTIVADQLTKSIATRTLALGTPVRLLPFLDLTRIHNTGIAFELFTGQQAAVMVLTVAAVVWMNIFFARSGARHASFPVAVGLLEGGAVSNLLDRIVNGHVTDFIHLHHWPIFNLADSSIVIGVALLLLGLAAHERRSASA